MLHNRLKNQELYTSRRKVTRSPAIAGTLCISDDRIYYGSAIFFSNTSNGEIGQDPVIWLAVAIG